VCHLEAQGRHTSGTRGEQHNAFLQVPHEVLEALKTPQKGGGDAGARSKRAALEALTAAPAGSSAVGEPPAAAMEFLHCVRQAVQLVGEEPPPPGASDIAHATHRAAVLHARNEYLMHVLEHGMVGMVSACHTVSPKVLGETQAIMGRMLSCAEMKRVLRGPSPPDAPPFQPQRLAQSAEVPSRCGRCGREHPMHNCYAKSHVEPPYAALQTPAWVMKLSRKGDGTAAEEAGGGWGGEDAEGTRYGGGYRDVGRGYNDRRFDDRGGDRGGDRGSDHGYNRGYDRSSGGRGGRGGGRGNGQRRGEYATSSRRRD